MLSHKNALIVQRKDGSGFTVSYKGADISAGFKMKWPTNEGKVYQISADGALKSGDKAFIYCEDVSTGTRLIPREFFFTKDRLITHYDIAFQAVSQNTWVGVLFYAANMDYCLEVDNFSIHASTMPSLEEIIKRNNEIIRKNVL